MNPVALSLYAAAALIVPGALAFFAARRGGIGVLWATLIVGALIAAVGWFMTREPLFGEAAIERSVRIYFVLLPGFVGLVTGAAMGALAGRR